MPPIRPGPALLVLLALAVVALGATVVTPADADLWGHLKFGEDIAANHHVVQIDSYSFTSDRSWTNHEWLSELSFFEAYHVGGSTGLIIFKLAMIAAMLAAIWRHLKRAGGPLMARSALLLVAFVGTFWRTHTIRPQLFSVLFFTLLLIVLVDADAGRRRGLFAVPPLFALWVNLHGGWIVGAAVLALWIAARCLGSWGPNSRTTQLIAAVVGLASAAATLANPYGIGLGTFLTETVRFERAGIQDWTSIASSPFALGTPWLLTLAVATVALWRSGLPRRLDYVAIVSVLAFASFRVSRLDAFFALAAVVFLGPHVVKAWPRDRQEARAMTTREAGPGLAGITVVALAAMLVPASVVMKPYVRCLTIGGNWQPPDADAGRFIALNRLTGRMLTWYDWGEYAIWHFGPALQVSMDGRRETVYTEATLQAHRRFYAAEDSALRYLSQLNPDYIWLPRDLPIVTRLQGTGWTPVFESQRSSVFARSGAGPFEQPAPAAAPRAMRCFPGP